MKPLGNKIAICVISTNDSYVYKAIITLLSTKKHNKENANFSYFVSGNFSEKYKRIIKKYGLEVMPMNMTNTFC